jgi:hypothetical protein
MEPCLSRHISGLDWSGDAGDPRYESQSPYLVIAAAHLAHDDLADLTTQLSDLRQRRGLPPNFVFKYSGAPRKLVEQFFLVIGSTGVTATIVYADKREWSPSSRRGRPRDRLNVLIARLICEADPRFIDGQVILVDRDRSEKGANRETERVVHQLLRVRIPPVSRMPVLRPCPDHRSDGLLVQVADMFAGAIRADPTLRSPVLTPVRNNIVLINATDIAI